MLGELLGGALVLVPLADLEVGAELVERAAQEDPLHGDAGQPEVTGGLQADGVERGGQVVGHVGGGELAERLGPGHRHLARLGELADGLAQLLDDAQADGPAAHLDHQGPDPAVAARPAQPVQHVGQDQPVPGHDGRHRIGGPGLGQAVAQVEFEDQRRGPLLAQPGQGGGDHLVWHGFRLSSASMASRDGNGWVRCSLGHRHWGKFGAAGLLAYAGEPDETQILLQRRVAWSHYGGTWGLPGGAADSHETPVEAALREAAEECGVPPDAVVVHGIYTDDHGGWAYHTVFARAAAPFAAYPASEETDDVDWVPADRAAELDLHPGLAAHWAELRAGLLPLTVIVDAANVVGSRPDGWWRDRAGAARRLVSGVTALAGAGVTGVPGRAGAAEPGSLAARLRGRARRPGQSRRSRGFRTGWGGWCAGLGAGLDGAGTGGCGWWARLVLAMTRSPSWPASCPAAGWSSPPTASCGAAARRPGPWSPAPAG